MQKLDYLRQKKLNPADGLRELLHSLEQRPFRFKSMTSTQALILLRELDQSHQLLQELEATGLNLLPERGRFNNIKGRVRPDMAALLKALGGPEALAEHRPKPAPSAERWWWYINDLVAVKRRQQLRIGGITFVIIALLFGGAVLAFRTILAPSPEAQIGFEVESEANDAIQHQNYREALAVIENGLRQLPNDAGFLLYKGVLHQILGEADEAEQAFVQAQAQLELTNFYLSRSQLYLQFQQPDMAEADARATIEIDERSARAWFLLGQALQQQGQEFQAISAYETAGQLAFENGDDQIVVMSRLAIGQITGGPGPQ